MFTSNILYIFFHLLSSRLYAVFRFVSLHDRIFILFLLMTWPEYLFKKNKTSRSLSESNGHPIRDTQADPEGDTPPFFVLGYRLVKMYFNRIFPVSSLSFFFLPCLVIFALNYLSVSFDISIKKMVSEIKRIPLMEMSGSTSEIHVHLYIVVQCGLSSLCEDGTTMSCRLCKIFCFGE